MDPCLFPFLFLLTSFFPSFLPGGWMGTVLFSPVLFPPLLLSSFLSLSFSISFPQGGWICSVLWPTFPLLLSLFCPSLLRSVFVPSFVRRGVPVHWSVLFCPPSSFLFPLSFFLSPRMQVPFSSGPRLLLLPLSFAIQSFPFLSFRLWSKPFGNLSRLWDVCVPYLMLF